MLRFLVKNYYFYSIEPLAFTRNIVSSKICYKKSLTFLKYKISLTNSLSNRLVDRGNYYQSYKLVRTYYISTLRANFTSNLQGPFTMFLWHQFENKKFLTAYYKNMLTREFDFVLLSRAAGINALFNLATTVTKKKKKRFYKHRTFFIPTNKRLLFVWRWLKTFLLTLKVKNVSQKLIYIKGFENFLLAPDSSHIITLFKLQIYKLHLLRIT